MKFSNIIRSSSCCLALFCALSGCVEQKPLALDQDDVRVAGFYGDYLLVSGVSLGTVVGQELALADSTDLNELLVRHYLTRESLSRKTEVYKRNPLLWRAVLEQVRLNIRKKTTVPVQ
ncbi:MAG: hypothetical protein JZU70_08545 [Chlorobium sp.]|jgi:hypothetical protein|nr:hypothetical protein [Chlorobium sp.]